ncbi:GIY-YIG nuclease family protein [Microbacterium sp. SD291]|nr:GIY-YIG nuclease family protein [Microbacterium sp. SD291]
MAWTYILRCADGSFYTGSTNGELESRVWQHNNDPDFAAKFTWKRRPVHLAYAERFDTVDVAFFREKQIQGWSRKKKLALIEERGDELPELSRSRQGTLRQAQRPSDGVSDPSAPEPPALGP